MVTRLAVTLSLLAFAACLLAGGLGAGNPFSTVVLRALLAMGATLVIGLIVGAMARAMLDENLKAAEEKIKNSSPNSRGSDR